MSLLANVVGVRFRLPRGRTAARAHRRARSRPCSGSSVTTDTSITGTTPRRCKPLAAAVRVVRRQRKPVGLSDGVEVGPARARATTRFSIRSSFAGLGDALRLLLDDASALSPDRVARVRAPCSSPWTRPAPATLAPRTSTSSQLHALAVRDRAQSRSRRKRADAALGRGRVAAGARRRAGRGVARAVAQLARRAGRARRARRHDGVPTLRELATLDGEWLPAIEQRAARATPAQDAWLSRSRALVEASAARARAHRRDRAPGGAGRRAGRDSSTTFSSTKSVTCWRSATTSPSTGATRRITICSHRKRASRSSSASRSRSCRRKAGSRWGACSRIPRARRRSCRGAARCSST